MNLSSLTALADIKAGIPPSQEMRKTPCTTTTHSVQNITRASEGGEDILSTIRRLEGQMKELREDN